MKTHRGALELTDTGTGSGLSLDNGNTTDPTVDGQITYVDGTGFRAMAETSVFTLSAAGGGGAAGTFDELYAADPELTVSGTSMVFAGTADVDVIHVTGSAAVDAGALIQIDSTGDAADIQGTGDLWNVTKTGYGTFVRTYVSGYVSTATAADLTLHTNDGTDSSSIVITDAANGDITFAMNGTGMVVISGTTETNPALTVSNGDVVVSDGSVAITDDDTAASLTITNTANFIATTSGVVTIVADTATAGNIIDVNGDAMTSGSVIHLDVTGATFTGEYIDCTDGGTSEFKVMRYGATTIKGTAAGTDAFTITAGDILLNDSDQNIVESEDGTTTLLLLDNKAGVIGTGAAVLKLDAGGDVHGSSFILDVVFSGTTPTAGATGVNVNMKKADVVGLNIDGAGTDTYEALKIDADSTDHDIAYIHSDAVIADDKALLNLNSAGAIASGGNILRVDAADATPASGAVYVEFDFANITSTNENVGLLIDAGGKKVQALSIDADPTTGSVAYMHSDAVIAADQGVLSLLSEGAIASGGNVLRIATGGTPDPGAIALEMDVQDDCQAILVDSDSATTHAVEIKGSGVLADNKAMLFVTSDGTALKAGSSLVRIEDSAFTSAGATVYGLEIDIDGNNMEALLVTAGTCSFAEAITVVAGGAAITGDSSIDGALVVNDSAADKDFRVETDTSEYAFEINGGNNNISINATGVSAHYDLGLFGDGTLCMTESATPTADTNYGKVYCKNDNKLYFQDGAGSEHELAFA